MDSKLLDRGTVSTHWRTREYGSTPWRLFRFLAATDHPRSAGTGTTHSW